MAQSVSKCVQDQWIASENIARFRERLKTETDICERKMLEGLIVLEKLRAEQGLVR